MRFSSGTGGHRIRKYVTEFRTTQSCAARSPTRLIFLHRQFRNSEDRTLVLHPDPAATRRNGQESYFGPVYGDALPGLYPF